MPIKCLKNQLLALVLTIITLTPTHAGTFKPIYKPYRGLSQSDKAILKGLWIEKKAERGNNSGKDGSFFTEVSKWHINSDKKPDYILRHCSASYGNTGCRISIYTSTNQGKWVSTVEPMTAFSVEFPGTRTKGYLDLVYGGPGTQSPPIWKWDGKKYVITKERLNR